MFTFSAPCATETVEGYVRSERGEKRRGVRVKSKEQRAESRKQKAGREFANLCQGRARHGGEFDFSPGKRRKE